MFGYFVFDVVLNCKQYEIFDIDVYFVLLLVEEFFECEVVGVVVVDVCEL